MKKYFLFIILIIVSILAILEYNHCNPNHNTKVVKTPTLNVQSSKFGVIKDIQWLDNSYSLIILSNQKENSGLNIYHLNLQTGKSKVICTINPHKNLKNFLGIDIQNNILIAYDKGLVKCNYYWDEAHNPKFNICYFYIKNFENANSITLNGTDIFFTNSNDKLIHKETCSTNLFKSTSNDDKTTKIYYKNPGYFVKTINLDNDSHLLYTSMNLGKLNIYKMNTDGFPINKLNKPIYKNVVDVQCKNSNYGFTLLSKSTVNNKLDLSICNCDGFNDEVFSKIDIIPFNTDKFGCVPASDMPTSYNNHIDIAYSCFNENHIGKIKFASNNSKPKTIIDNKYIFGPIKVNNIRYASNKYNTFILYFYEENNKTKINICNDQGKLVKDITSFII